MTQVADPIPFARRTGPRVTAHRAQPVEAPENDRRLAAMLGVATLVGLAGWGALAWGALAAL